MKTDVRFTAKELKNAFKLHYDTVYPIRSRLLLFFGLFMWIVGLVFIYFNFPPKYEYLKYLITIVGGFYVLMYYYRRKKLFERASNQNTFKGEFTFEVNKKGIFFGKNDEVSYCVWEDVSSIIKDENNILFYFGKDKFYILPLENLNSKQKEELDKILKERNFK